MSNKKKVVDYITNRRKGKKEEAKYRSNKLYENMINKINDDITVIDLKNLSGLTRRTIYNYIEDGLLSVEIKKNKKTIPITECVKFLEYSDNLKKIRNIRSKK